MTVIEPSRSEYDQRLFAEAVDDRWLDNWTPGDVLELDGLWVREVKGRKRRLDDSDFDDLKLEVSTTGTGSWVAPTLLVPSVFLARKALNEERRYPNSRFGGWMPYKMIADAAKVGPTAADERWVKSYQRRRS